MKLTLERGRGIGMDASNHSITQKLEGFLHTARKLEDAVSEEKKRSQKIAQEYLATRTTLENAVHELKNRLSGRESSIQSLKQNLAEANAREKKITADLHQFQTAWNEVLAREAHARKYVAEFEKGRKLIAEQRAQIISLENLVKLNHENTATHSRRAETAERELQGAMVRLKTTEAKLSESQNTLAAANQNQRNIQNEIARLEIVFQNKFREQIDAEKRRIQADLNAKSAADQEKFRESARAQMHGEIDRKVSAIERQIATERQGREVAQIELNQTRSQLAAIEVEKKSEIERGRTRLQALTAENHALKEEIRLGGERKLGEVAALKREIAMVQMSLSNAQASFETTKKEMNKAALVERLRNDAESRELRDKLIRIMEHGVLAEKVDGVPAGMPVFSAIPVTGRSSDAGTPSEGGRTL